MADYMTWTREMVADKVRPNSKLFIPVTVGHSKTVHVGLATSDENGQVQVHACKCGAGRAYRGTRRQSSIRVCANNDSEITCGKCAGSMAGMQMNLHRGWYYNEDETKQEKPEMNIFTPVPYNPNARIDKLVVATANTLYPYPRELTELETSLRLDMRNLYYIRTGVSGMEYPDAKHMRRLVRAGLIEPDFGSGVKFTALGEAIIREFGMRDAFDFIFGFITEAMMIEASIKIQNTINQIISAAYATDQVRINPCDLNRVNIYAPDGFTEQTWKAMRIETVMKGNSSEMSGPAADLSYSPYAQEFVLRIAVYGEVADPVRLADALSRLVKVQAGVNRAFYSRFEEQ